MVKINDIADISSTRDRDTSGQLTRNAWSCIFLDTFDKIAKVAGKRGIELYYRLAQAYEAFVTTWQGEGEEQIAKVVDENYVNVSQTASLVTAGLWGGANPNIAGPYTIQKWSDVHFSVYEPPDQTYIFPGCTTVSAITYGTAITGSTSQVIPTFKYSWYVLEDPYGNVPTVETLKLYFGAVEKQTADQRVALFNLMLSGSWPVYKLDTPRIEQLFDNNTVQVIIDIPPPQIDYSLYNIANQQTGFGVPIPPPPGFPVEEIT